MSETHTTPEHDKAALYAYAVYADIETTPAGETLVTFLWENDDPYTLDLAPFAVELWHEKAVIGECHFNPSSNAYEIETTSPSFALIERDDYDTHTQFIEAVLTIASDNGLAPSGYWQCEKASFWAAQ